MGGIKILQKVQNKRIRRDCYFASIIRHYAVGCRVRCVIGNMYNYFSLMLPLRFHFYIAGMECTRFSIKSINHGTL